MPRRPRVLSLRTGDTVELPQLVPSFSSKGFGTYEDDSGATRSEANQSFEIMNAVLDESFLISAFDIFHGFIPAPRESLENTSAVLVDSGGYEKSPFFDQTEPVFRPFPNPAFELDDYRQVLDALDGSLPIIAASPDWYTADSPIGDQIAFAQEFLAGYPFTRSLIIKPGGKRYVRVEDIVPHIRDLSAFDVVGVTEKELGMNLKQRLATVSHLRTELDRAGLDRTPIHVWGGLDPVITPLYYFAGAEIFDGISWLRYAFHKGTAIYKDAWHILDGEVTKSYTQSRMELWSKNLSELRRLASTLRMFNQGGREDFAVFEWHRAELERAFGVLTSEVTEMKEVNDGW